MVSESLTHFMKLKQHIRQTTLLPTTVWGTQFPLVPFMYSCDISYYQIVANTNGTMVKAAGQEIYLNAGEYTESIHIVRSFDAHIELSHSIGRIWSGMYTLVLCRMMLL